MSLRRATILILACTLLFVAGCSHASRPSAPSPTGSIDGSIAFSGILPHPDATTQPQDAACAKLETLSKRWREDKSHPRTMPPVFVWISSSIASRNFQQTPTQTVVAVLQCRFHPQLVGVMPNQPVTFTDNNPIPFHIRVASTVSGNPTFSLALQPERPGQIRTFPHPELMIPVTLASVSGARAYINVVPNPYFAVSGPEGYFRLRDLPPGTYTLSAIRPGSPVQEQSVTIQPGVATKIRFAFAATPASDSSHD